MNNDYMDIFSDIREHDQYDITNSNICKTLDIKYKISDIFNSKIPISNDLISYVDRLGYHYIIKLFLFTPAIIEINKWINDFDIFKIDTTLIINYLRELIQKYNINIFKDLTYTKTTKLTKEYKECMNKYITLNPYIRPSEFNHIFEYYWDSDIKELESYLFPERSNKKEKKKDDIKRIDLKEVKHLMEDFILKNNKCKECPLKSERNILTFDSNARRYIQNDSIDILFIDGIPTNTDIELNTPLVSEEGKLLRKYINKFIDKKYKYVMTNSILCYSDNKVDLSYKEKCFKHISFLIKTLRPKLVVLIGEYSFNCNLPNIKTNFIQTCGNLYDIRGTFYIPIPDILDDINLCNGKNLENSFNNISLFLSGAKEVTLSKKDDSGGSNENITKIEVNNIVKNKLSGMKDKNNKNPYVNAIEENIIFHKGKLLIDEDNTGLYHKLSNNNFYNDNYKIVDCENTYGILGNYRLYIRDVDNPNIRIVSDNRAEGIYLYYKENKDSQNREICVDLHDLDKMVIKSNERDILENLRSDIKTEPFNQFTYYDFPREGRYKFKVLRDINLKRNKNANDRRPDILFIDIETYFNGKNKDVIDLTLNKDIFVNPKDITFDNHPINAITMIRKSYQHNIIDGVCIYYHPTDTISKNIETLYNNIKIIKCNSEHELLDLLLKYWHYFNCDIITGWNVQFDMGNIINRLSYIGQTDYLSIFNTPVIVKEKTKGDNKNRIYKEFFIDGYKVMDLKDVYEYISPSKEPIMTLNYIAEKHLGEKKEEYEGTLNNLYEKNIDLFIKYNIKDVFLILRLEDKFGHISSICNEMRTWANISIDKSMSKTSTIYGYSSTLMKEDFNKVLRFPFKSREKVTYPGAFVKTPKVGITDYVIDLDYKSLYPSIMCTNNIGFESWVGLLDRNLTRNYIYNRDTIKNKNFVLFDVWKNCERNLTFDQFEEYMADKIITIQGTIFYKPSFKESFIRYCMNKLINLRDEFKSIMKKSDDKGEISLYNTRQLATKEFANSYYGGQGTPGYDYYEPIIAETITTVGQEAIKFSTAGMNYFNDMLDRYNDINKIPMDSEIIYNHPSFNAIRHIDVNQPIQSDIIIYTDTDSIFIDLGMILKKLNITENKIEAINDILIPYIETFVNEKLLKDIYLNTHKLSLDSFYLKLKQEWIARRVLTTGKKKKYILYVIDEEKKKCDKLIFKGVEIIRSNYAEFSKKYLSELANKILRSEDVNVAHLLNYIEEKSNEFRNRAAVGDTFIAKTFSFNIERENYSKRETASEAAYLWNDLGIDEANPINLYDKSYYYNIKAVKENNLPERCKAKMEEIRNTPDRVIKEVSIPSLYKNMPVEYFEIDVDVMLYKNWYKIIENLFGFILNVTYMDPEKIPKRLTKKMFDSVRLDSNLDYMLI